MGKKKMEAAIVTQVKYRLLLQLIPLIFICIN